MAEANHRVHQPLVGAMADVIHLPTSLSSDEVKLTCGKGGGEAAAATRRCAGLAAVLQRNQQPGEPVPQGPPIGTAGASSTVADCAKIKTGAQPQAH